MNLAALAVNGLWAGQCLPDAIRFHGALRDPRRAQERVLDRILRAARPTQFGRAHGFAGIRSVADFQERVPLSDDDALRGPVAAMMRGEADLLFPGRPRRLLPTSGSTSASKWIPHTAALRREFQSAVGPWMAALFRHHPAVLAGTAYWSISPAIAVPQVESCVPLGFDDDAEYLSPILARLLARTLAVPAGVARIGDTEAFRYVTLLFLLKARDLAFVSIWSPTFLTRLLEPLMAWREPLTRDLAAGTLRPDLRLCAELRTAFLARLGAHPKRAAEVRAVLERPGAGDGPRFEALWPRLRVISCWTQAAARGPAAELRRLFPRVAIEPKGLLATEGVVSIPMGARPGGALALRSHFLEFVPQGDDRGVRTAWELERGGRYAVVLTTGGGLYRYRLGDVVQVTGFVHRCPLIEFVGREGKTSDLCGEKLAEAHVAAVLARLLAAWSQRALFVLLAPDGVPAAPHYALFLAGEEKPSQEWLTDLGAALEAALRENVAYDCCRNLRQLQAAQVVWLPMRAAEAFHRYHDVCLRQGQRAGDIKPACLDARPIWREALTAGS